jgi:predicted ATPase
VVCAARRCRGCDRFSNDPGLLVLDNLEQLRGAPAAIGELIQAAPKLRVLATSQMPLHLSSEFVVALASLSSDEGVRLFSERATLRMASFDAVDYSDAIKAICERLDGLPLAIECDAGFIAG